MHNTHNNPPPQPTVYNMYGIIDTPICAGLKWLETFFNGVQQSFVYGGAAAVAYAIPSMFSWPGTPLPTLRLPERMKLRMPLR